MDTHVYAMIRKTIKYFMAILMAVTMAKISIAAAENASSFERIQEMIEEDKTLRQRIEDGENVFVKTIIVNSERKLSETEIKNMFSPFQDKFITKENVLQIIYSLKKAYQEKGVELTSPGISYEITKNNILEITVKELAK